MLQNWFGSAGNAIPATLYVALSTTVPAADGSSFTEPVGNGYARVAVANNGTNWVAANPQPGSGYEVQNNGIIQFPIATGAWGTVVYVGIFDAANGGNLLAIVAIPAQAVVAFQSVVFPAGSITVTET